MTSESKSQRLCHTVRNSVSCSLNFILQSQKNSPRIFLIFLQQNLPLSTCQHLRWPEHVNWREAFLTITHKLISAQTRTWRWNDPITLITAQTTQYSLSNYSSIWKFFMLVKLEGPSPEQHISLATNDPKSLKSSLGCGRLSCQIKRFQHSNHGAKKIWATSFNGGGILPGPDESSNKILVNVKKMWHGCPALWGCEWTPFP